MRDSDATLMPFGCQRVRKSELTKKRTKIEMELEKKPQFAVYQGILTSISMVEMPLTAEKPLKQQHQSAMRPVSS